MIGRFENRISVAILFHENSWTDWHEFENLADFEDKKFDASKLDPMIGYRRAGITNEMLIDPYLEIFHVTWMKKMKDQK